MPRHFTLPNAAARHPLRRRIPLNGAMREASAVMDHEGRSYAVGAGHPLRRRLPLLAARRRMANEDVAFFLTTFASAFVILYSFVV